MPIMLSLIYLAIAIIGVVSCIAGAALAYFGIVAPVQGFMLFAFGLIVGSIVALIGIGVVIKGGSALTYTAAALGVPLLIALIATIVIGAKYPPINDISTETLYPPEFKHAQERPGNENTDFTFPKDFVPIIKEKYPDLKPLAIEGDAENILLRAAEIARNQPGWSVTQSEIREKESVIEGYATSGMFRFVDDWVIRVTKANGGAVVDMRSRSREGVGDFGANAARIRRFMAALQPSVAR